MAKLPYVVRKRKKSKITGKPDTISHQKIAAIHVGGRIELIPTLSSSGLAHMAAELEHFYTIKGPGGGQG